MLLTPSMPQLNVARTSGSSSVVLNWAPTESLLWCVLWIIQADSHLWSWIGHSSILLDVMWWKGGHFEFVLSGKRSNRRGGRHPCICEVSPGVCVLCLCVNKYLFVIYSFPRGQNESLSHVDCWFSTMATTGAREARVLHSDHNCTNSC